jgi:very-short-patch-repair endonuclease
MRNTEEIVMDAELLRAYEVWMANHRRLRTGERKRRLIDLSNHAEKMFILKVWWPAFGHLKGLHPEFEVRDFKDGWRYLDFAFISEGLRVCIEIDGYGSHWRDLNRTQFSNHLMRQNQLVIDGWLVFRFSYDDLLEKPRRCQQILQQLLGRASGLRTTNNQALLPTEKVLMNLAVSLTKPITPKHAAGELGLHRTTVMRYLHSLVKKGLLMPVRSDTTRVYSYKVNVASRPFGIY